MSTFGIDARAATEEGAGGGRVVREVVRALAARDDGHRYRLYARERWAEPLGDRFEWHLDTSRDPVWNLRTARHARRTCDAYLSTNSYLTAAAMGGPCAAVVHDLVAFDPALRPKRRSAIIERLTLRPAVKRAAALIVVSEATGAALMDRHPEAAPKVAVAHLGISPQLADPSAALPVGVPPSGFVLAVGTLEPRKNLPRLVEAYRRLPDALQRAHPLVVCGRLGWEAGETLAALASLGDRAVVPGFVTDAELGLLYQRCALFAYPSLGEGFGLPVLEAMAAGAAVLTSSTSSLPEVGGDAVAYCDPTDAATIAQGLEALLQDPERRAALANAGRARASHFSWARTAAVILEVLERIAHRGQSP